MAYLKPQTPLKDLNSGDYFYPLTTIDQVITGNNRLLAFMSEDNNLLNLSNIGNININGTSYFVNTITGDILSAWHILAGRPSNTTNFRTYFETVTNLHHENPNRTDSEISYNRFFASNSDQTTYGPGALNLPAVDQHVLSFGIDNGVAWSRHIALDIRSNKMFLGARNDNTWQAWSEVIVHDLAQTITGAKTFTAGLTATNRIYLTNWLQFQDSSGLYFPNSGSGTNFYPANDCTYGSFQISGTKGGYFGITMGNSNSYMTAMSSGVHNGLYTSSNDFWGFYYHRDNKRCSIAGSSNDGYTCQINGTANITSVGYGQNGIWVKTGSAGNNAYVDSGGAIEIREVATVTTNQSDFSYAPKLGFHWGGRYQGTIALHSNGQFYISLSGGAGNATVRAGAVYGAVWNDYAEMRNVPEANTFIEKENIRDIKLAGRCVCEIGNDTMILTDKRMQPGCKIISDTFGFNIGETKDCKTPVAVSGRVLAYIYEGREAAKNAIGKPVCSGPNGTVSIMTDEEYRNKGYCCVGIISAVPDYEVWGTGNVKVDGRIWVYVR